MPLLFICLPNKNYLSRKAEKIKIIAISIIMIIIKRERDLLRWKDKGWILVYGRRKTGKSFFVKNWVRYDEYFFVQRNGSIFDQNMQKITMDSLMYYLKKELGRKKIVIDEFHRLHDEFLDFLHMMGGKGDLVLVTSTHWLSRKLLGRSSPLLGLVYEFPMGLADERDVLNSLSCRHEQQLSIVAMQEMCGWFLT